MNGNGRKPQKKNSLALFRKFQREDNQPVAKGDGISGEGDWRAPGSTGPSVKGTRKDGSPWQLWNVTIRPAQGEDRVLVAVPTDALDAVLRIVRGGDNAATDGEGGHASPSAQPALPF